MNRSQTKVYFDNLMEEDEGEGWCGGGGGGIQGNEVGEEMDGESSCGDSRAGDFLV